MKIDCYLSLDKTIARELLESVGMPWEALDFLDEYIRRVGRSLPKEEYIQRGKDIWIEKSAKISPSASISGPLIIGKETELRPNAYIRGSVIIGSGCVIGNASEVKSSIIFDGVALPHYNYVGNSILGWRAHLGAGVILSNLKSDRGCIKVTINDEKVDTGLRKLGSIIGDFVEIGAGSVLMPGTIVGSGARIYPLTMARGYIKGEHILRPDGSQIRMERADG